MKSSLFQAIINTSLGLLILGTIVAPFLIWGYVAAKVICLGLMGVVILMGACFIGSIIRAR